MHVMDAEGHAGSSAGQPWPCQVRCASLPGLAHITRTHTHTHTHTLTCTNTRTHTRALTTHMHSHAHKCTHALQFNVKLSEASKAFGKKFACGCSVTKNATGEEQIDMQVRPWRVYGTRPARTWTCHALPRAVKQSATPNARLHGACAADAGCV